MSTDTQDKGSLIERLFAAGSHYGFSKSRRHPTATPYIFGNKQGTDIFDLEKTSELIASAKATLKEAGESGKTVLFVSTKDETAKLMKEAAEQAEMPYVTNRWIGGMFTNFSEIRKRIERLKALTAERESGELDRKYTKKERVMISREVDKLEFNFGGIKEIDKVPALMVIIDPRHDSIAVEEARDLNIPTIAIMSSDSDVSLVTQPVMANDSLTTSVSLVLKELTGAFLEGRKNYTPKPPARTQARPSREGFARRPRPTTDRR